MLVVLVGGYLMAGGANAVNMYIDRDIDDRMARTRLRPIPSGRMTPRAVLAFGVALATAATFLLARFANVLTAALALAGFYFYVFVYTRWLKRTTPQNIVIGGAAGAFPPLVGWAAVTGRVDLTAVYLFLIVFYWTPPHFWALALLKQRDYGRAGVPMAPLVWGERETMRPDAVVHADPASPLTIAPGRVRRVRPHLPRLGARARRDPAVWACSACARRRTGRAGVVGVQVLAALSRAALRGDGGGPQGAGADDGALRGVRTASHSARAAKRLPSPRPLGRLLPRIRPYLLAPRRGLRLPARRAPASGSPSRSSSATCSTRRSSQRDAALLNRIALGLLGLFALQAVDQLRAGVSC